MDVFSNRLDELIRANLQGLRDSYFDWLLIATGAVFVGVVMEGPEVVRDLLDGFRMRLNPDAPHASVSHPLWVLVLSSIGWLLISGGVIGEGIFEAFVSKTDGLVQTFNDILLIDARLQTAKANERTLHEIDARIALEKQIHSQGPRYVLLRESAPTLAKELAPFAGQRTALLICGMYRTERETLNTWGALADILGSGRVNGVQGARWKLVRPDPIWDNCSPSMQGVLVFVSSLAPQRTRDAADALSRAILKTLPLWDDVKIPGVVNSAFVKKIIASGFMDKDDPSRLVTEDPDLIAIGIGEHPPL